jgi:hypothetical protein
MPSRLGIEIPRSPTKPRVIDRSADVRADWISWKRLSSGAVAFADDEGATFRDTG